MGARSALQFHRRSGWRRAVQGRHDRSARQLVRHGGYRRIGGCEGGCGVVYKLTKYGGTWTQTVIHAFTGGDDGSGPGARVTVDRSGDIYGMTPTGGANGVGTVYKIHPQSGSWDFQVVHTFTDGADGATGSAGRMLLEHGRLYGAATAGGLYGSGVVFELTPTAGDGISGRYILFTANPTGVFLTARYSALLRVKSTGLPITVVKTVSALFTNCRRGPMTLCNGMEE